MKPPNKHVSSCLRFDERAVRQREKTFLCAAAVLAMLLLPRVTSAQKPYALPEAPAFTILDVTPAEILRPTTARALATAIVNAINPEGKVQQGFALDVAPWSLIPNL